MPHTLRSFLASLDNQLLYVKEPVDPVTQVGALCAESAGPVMFENLKGFPGWRLTDILVKGRRGQATALGVQNANEVCPELARRMARGRGKSVMVNTGPVKDVKMLDGNVDIRKLPIPTHSKGDAGRYLGSGITITKDPDTGVRNEAVIRLMLTDDPKRCSFRMAARHNWAHYLKYAERNQPMPMAFAIGLHPVYEIMANWSGRHEDFDELEYGAGVLGEDIEMVKCENIDLEVPAHAEVVIEGYAHQSEMMNEGPFGEFTNYGGGMEGPAPVFTVTAITHRKDPIFRHMQAVRFTDHQALITLPMEAVYYNRLRETHGNTNIRDVFVPPWASQFIMLVQMEAQWDGQARDVLLSALSGPNLHVKIAIGVDEDVDLYNAQDVLWAVSTRVDPAKDVIVLPHERGHPLDISMTTVGSDATFLRVGGKLAIDATKPATWRTRERAEFTRIDPMGFHDPSIAKLLEIVSRPR
jgi:2,5-furandicarboxylate decarboxylase 1